MKYLLSVLALASLMACSKGEQAHRSDPPTPPGPEAPSGAVSDDEFNVGDLAGPDELSEDEQDGLEPEEREMFYRATTPKQLEAHAAKRVQVVVTKSMKPRGYQFLQVIVDGNVEYDAPVSTAWERNAKAKTRTYYAYTPVGKFFPDAMEIKRFSNTWQVMLHHVIRFSGGVWMHATTPDHFMELGAPASGGCVRLHPVDAKNVYEILAKYGVSNVAITVNPADASEKQVPWKELKLQAPEPLVKWRGQNQVK